MSAFRPNFKAFRVVVLHYTGDDWPEVTRNAFAGWNEFNEITALGGWENRNESAGPVAWRAQAGAVAEAAIAGQHQDLVLAASPIQRLSQVAGGVDESLRQVVLPDGQPAGLPIFRLGLAARLLPARNLFKADGQSARADLGKPVQWH